MRKNHHGTNHKLVKRAFALCLALAVICSCLLPVFATETGNGIATLVDDAAVMPMLPSEDDGFAVDDGSFGVDTQEDVADSQQPAVTEDTSASGSTSLDPSTITEVKIPADATDVVKNANGSYSYTTELGRVTVFPDASSVDLGDGTVKPNPNLDKDDAAFGVLPIEYHFWLKQLDEYDFKNLAWEAEMADMSETEYLSLFGASDQFPIWHMDTIASTDNLSNYRFANPATSDDPTGAGRTFDYWYTVDAYGTKQKFDFYASYGDENNTIVNVFAAWKTTSGDSKTDDTKTDDSKTSTTGTVSAKANIYGTTDEVTVTVTGLPAEAKTLSVVPMDDENAMQNFYDLYAANGGTLAPILGFEIEPKDASGNVVQPVGPVTVTISGLETLGWDVETMGALKVLHQVTKSDIQTINAAYTNGTLTFHTSSFSPFVIASKNGFEAGTLQNRSFDIKPGGTQSVTVSGIQSNGFSSTCSQTGITATIQSGYYGNSGYVISVGQNVPAGQYTLTVNYTYRNGWNGSTTSTQDIVTVNVYYDATVKNVMDHAIVRYAYYTSTGTNTGTWTWSDEYKSGEDFSVSYNSGSNPTHYVFFAKPEENYLLTGFTITDKNNSTFYDLYSIDNYASSAIKDYPGLADLIKTAKSQGYEYITLNGYKTSAVASGAKAVFTQKFTGRKPALTVTATASPAKNVKPGDNVRFTITVASETVNGSTVEDFNPKSVTVNGTVYTDVQFTQQKDGTYTATIDYTAKSEDWITGNIQLDVVANITYKYELPVTDRYDNNSKITSTSTIENEGSVTVTLADKLGVAYEVTYDPADKADLNPSIKRPAPVDNTDYFEGNPVKVADYDTTDIIDTKNGGTWKFTGWKLAGDTSGKLYSAGDILTMGNQRMLFQGVWTFEKTFCNVKITKVVDGLLGDRTKDFKFSVSFDAATTNVTAAKYKADGTQVDSDVNLNDFTLKNGEYVILSNVPMNALMTVKEIAPGAHYKVTATEYATEQSGANDVSFVYKTIGNSNTESTAVVSYNAEGSYTTGKSVTNNEIVVTNKADIIPDTGVILDTLPYIVILAVVVGGGALLVLRKRRKDEDD